MKTCEWLIDGSQSCGKPCEGKNALCATHSRLSRKLVDDAKKQAEKRSSLLQKPPKVRVKDLKDSNLWIPFSKYIRLRDSDDNGLCTCFTCGLQQDWNSGGMQAGHFIGRRHWATRYHEKNVHAQCTRCNMYQSGMQYEYGLKLDAKYGEGTSKELWQLSTMTVKFTQQEIDDLAAHYRNLVKEKLRNMSAQNVFVNQERETI